MTLSLYTNKSLLELGVPINILVPFIGLFKKKDKHGEVLHGRFDDFIAEANNFLKLTNPADCDAFLLPIRYDLLNKDERRSKQIIRFYKKAQQYDKNVITFAGHDLTNIFIPFENVLVFNSACTKSKKPANFYSYPHFFEDFFQYEEYVDFKVKDKQKKPIVGFCGFAPPLNIKMGRQKVVSSIKLALNYLNIIQHFPSKAAHSFRARAIISLQNSGYIDPNFRIKGNFGFGSKGELNGDETHESNLQFRVNYIKNILESDYTLCVRGIGNNSIRLFECLCCGRIPVFVDTDCYLPFENIINWKELCVWVDEGDMANIDEIIAEYHANISEKKYKEKQLKARKVWEEYLSPVGFFKNFNRLL